MKNYSTWNKKIKKPDFSFCFDRGACQYLIYTTVQVRIQRQLVSGRLEYNLNLSGINNGETTRYST